MSAELLKIKSDLGLQAQLNNIELSSPHAEIAAGAARLVVIFDTLQYLISQQPLHKATDHGEAAETERGPR